MFDNCIILDDNLSKEIDTSAQWTILVVDDDMDVHVATRFCLANTVFANRKLNFIDAYSGKEAINLLKMHDNIDLILLDVVMENQDAGMDVVRWLRQSVDPAKIPKIVLRTGQPGLNQISDIINANFVDAVLQKSTTTYASLVNTVSQLLLKTCSEVNDTAKE